MKYYLKRGTLNYFLYFFVDLGVWMLRCYGVSRLCKDDGGDVKAFDGDVHAFGGDVKRFGGIYLGI